MKIKVKFTMSMYKYNQSQIPTIVHALILFKFILRFDSKIIKQNFLNLTYKYLRNISDELTEVIPVLQLVGQ